MVCVLAAILQQSKADPILQLTAGPAMDPMSMDLMGGVDNGNGTFDYDGSASMEGMWNLTYDLTVDPDPYVSAVFGFQNMSSVEQTFIVNVTLPITPPVIPSSLIGGSVGGSLTDANFDGVASVGTVMGSPMYYGEIDGAGVLPIIPHDTSYSTSFAGQTINIPATNVGLPGPSISGPAANNTIGITHKFTLTPGDKVSFTSFFVVEAIPEPASAGLIALISGGALFVRRRFILS